jgi:hypothetical protein
LVYATNLDSTATWHPVGTKPATGTSDFQTDTSPATGPRYYRVYYQ